MIQLEAACPKDSAPALVLRWSQRGLQALFGRRAGRCIAMTIALITASAVSVRSAPSASADFGVNLKDAVTQAHRASSCAQLRPEPLADQTAAVVTRSTEKFLNHDARAIPVTDPLPILKGLGLNTGKAELLQGAGKTEADSIKSILVSGYKALPDCAYSQYGTSTLPNSNQGQYYLSAVVLVGP